MLMSDALLAQCGHNVLQVVPQVFQTSCKEF